MKLTLAAALSIAILTPVADQRLRAIDLYSVFSEVNKAYFGSQLPSVQIEWAELVSGRARTTRFGKTDFRIQLDPKRIDSELLIVRAMEHESCHIFIRLNGPSEASHGPGFLSCMERFSPPEIDVERLLEGARPRAIGSDVLN